jgi:hypothetical protein
MLIANIWILCPSVMPISALEIERGIEPTDGVRHGSIRRWVASVDVKDTAVRSIEPELEKGMWVRHLGACPIVGRQEANTENRHAPEESGTK